jgi:5-formyltetrahydrofolate cyclo-ligase
VAFDRSCYRLGYGKGFYDKLLSDKKRVDISAMGQECPVLIGLSYEMQIVKELPFKAHDMQVDMIVTEERILRCNEQGKSHGRHTSCH